MWQLRSARLQQRARVQTCPYLVATLALVAIARQMEAANVRLIKVQVNLQWHS